MKRFVTDFTPMFNETMAKGRGAVALCPAFLSDGELLGFHRESNCWGKIKFKALEERLPRNFRYETHALQGALLCKLRGDEDAKAISVLNLLSGNHRAITCPLLPGSGWFVHPPVLTLLDEGVYHILLRSQSYDQSGRGRFETACYDSSSDSWALDSRPIEYCLSHDVHFSRSGPEFLDEAVYWCEGVLDADEHVSRIRVFLEDECCESDTDFSWGSSVMDESDPDLAIDIDDSNEYPKDTTDLPNAFYCEERKEDWYEFSSSESSLSDDETSVEDMDMLSMSSEDRDDDCFQDIHDPVIEFVPDDKDFLKDLSICALQCGKRSVLAVILYYEDLLGVQGWSARAKVYQFDKDDSFRWVELSTSPAYCLTLGLAEEELVVTADESYIYFCGTDLNSYHLDSKTWVNHGTIPDAAYWESNCLKDCLRFQTGMDPFLGP
ncbi:hypothetical protein R1flu_007126 [Riccia fluitans]|uniref:Uncharacterized protein n=1 Tax=Riccia fluitans TaxID=41844 RepID=A0ABD1Z229_9MARC